MTKEVLVSVRGKQIGYEGEDNIEIISQGEYYERGGKIYIKYDEQIEDENGVVHSMVKISDDEVELTKKGSVKVNMIFRENEKINSAYDTPYGQLMLGIYTTSIEKTIEETFVELVIKYSVEANGDFLSEATVAIKVQPRCNASVKLV